MTATSRDRREEQRSEHRKSNGNDDEQHGGVVLLLPVADLHTKTDGRFLAVRTDGCQGDAMEPALHGSGHHEVTVEHAVSTDRGSAEKHRSREHPRLHLRTWLESGHPYPDAVADLQPDGALGIEGDRRALCIDGRERCVERTD